jgi:hypothetical protein
VIETRLALVEGLVAGQIGEAMQPKQRVAELVDDMPEWASVLVEDRLDSQNPGVPLLADGEVGHSHGDMRDGGHHR